MAIISYFSFCKVHSRRSSDETYSRFSSSLSASMSALSADSARNYTSEPARSFGVFGSGVTSEFVEVLIAKLS